jgi:hypothetical protein
MPYEGTVPTADPALRHDGGVMEKGNWFQNVPTDEGTITRMWDSAEAMPSLPEIEEPWLWLARSA